MWERKTGIILTFVFFLGLAILIYPFAASYWNLKTQSKSVVHYDESVNALSPEECENYRSEAIKYNDDLRTMSFPFTQYIELGQERYERILNVENNGIMGYISIEKIRVELPIYHGTSTEVLNVAAGHLEGSSFPIGGPGTHSVITAHRGLPTARMFTDIDKLQTGDTFKICVLDQVLEYVVDNISIVYPEEVDKLKIEEGKDYCTLVACTPYGINTHRMLVRGIRKGSSDEAFVPSDVFMIDPLMTAVFMGVPLLMLLLVFMLLPGRKNTKSINIKKRKKKYDR